MFLQALTLFHVVISLVGILSGFAVVIALTRNRLLDSTISIFLLTTTITSVTGFFFPIHGLTPGLVLGVLSLVALGIAFWTQRHLGEWRRSYAVSVVVALYFNFFVLIVQSFEKIPALHALAPTQKEAPFVAAQLFALALFIGLGVAAVRNFRGSSVRVLSRAA